jgi:hypothetical protein
MAAGTFKPRARLPAWLGIRSGMRAGSLFVAFLMLAGGALGIGGLTLADDALTQLYQAQLQPVAAIGKIEARLSDSRATMLETAWPGVSAPPAPQALDSQITKLRANRDEIHTLLGQLTGIDAQVAQPQQLLAAALTRYTDDGLRLVERAAAHDDPAQVDQLVAQRVLPLEQAATAAAGGCATRSRWPHAPSTKTRWTATRASATSPSPALSSGCWWWPWWGICSSAASSIRSTPPSAA